MRCLLRVFLLLNRILLPWWAESLVALRVKFNCSLIRVSRLVDEFSQRHLAAQDVIDGWSPGEEVAIGLGYVVQRASLFRWRIDWVHFGSAFWKNAVGVAKEIHWVETVGIQCCAVSMTKWALLVLGANLFGTIWLILNDSWMLVGIIFICTDVNFLITRLFRRNHKLFWHRSISRAHLIPKWATRDDI